jgi:hypothetical protein
MLQCLSYQQPVTQCLNYQQHVTVSQLSATCYSVSITSNMLQCLNYQQHVQYIVSQLSATYYSVSNICSMLQIPNFQQHVTVSQLSATWYSASTIGSKVKVSQLSAACYNVSTTSSMLQWLKYRQPVQYIACTDGRKENSRHVAKIFQKSASHNTGGNPRKQYISLAFNCLSSEEIYRQIRLRKLSIWKKNRCL